VESAGEEAPARVLAAGREGDGAVGVVAAAGEPACLASSFFFESLFFFSSSFFFASAFFFSSFFRRSI
jgi:hypothetical protein